MSSTIVLHAIPAVESDLTTLFNQSFKTNCRRDLNLIDHRRRGFTASTVDE